jgi:hypothetical protein
VLPAAEVILKAEGHYSRARLQPYQDRLVQRFGREKPDWTRTISALIPNQVIPSAARGLLATRWFSRHLINRWFLHSHVPALTLP